MWFYSVAYHIDLSSYIETSLYLMGMGFHDGSGSSESACNAGYLGSIPELGGSPGEWSDYPLQYSCLENYMNRRAWCTSPRFGKSLKRNNNTRMGP